MISSFLIPGALTKFPDLPDEIIIPFLAPFRQVRFRKVMSRILFHYTFRIVVFSGVSLFGKQVFAISGVVELLDLRCFGGDVYDFPFPERAHFHFLVCI